MSKLSKNQIQTLAREIVSTHRGGIRYSELVRAIAQAHPETPINTVHGSVWNLATLFPREISKPSRGLLKPADAESIATIEEDTPDQQKAAQVRELNFYEPFAEWLKNDLDEVTVATSLGGAGLKSKWGTPDVVGIYKPIAADRIKFPIEIVSAELKIDPAAPVVAFGQAAAYRLFSNKAYVVLPSSLSEEDLGRSEALAMLFGIGLVLFDVDVKNPEFRIRVRAQRFLPDMFYVNEFADRLAQHSPEMFERLFA